MNVKSKIRLCLLAAAILTCGCKRSEKNGTSQDDTAIRTASDTYMNAFNNQDTDAIASLWTDDGVFINFTRRETIQGKNEIANYLKEQFQKDGKAHLEITIDSIDFKETGKAIEKGSASISYGTEPTGQIVFQAEYIKNDQSWLLQKLTEIELISPPSHFEHLKELDWFVGSWIDQDDDDPMDTKSTYSWDKNKNFLTQSFTLTVLDQKEISGQQIIGWDPIKKTICSWIFDSDGAFGKGFWVKQDDSWYASVSFTLFDGRRASATHVYTKINDNTYTFSSENRDIDGKLLPNIGPFKAVRK